MIVVRIAMNVKSENRERFLELMQEDVQISGVFEGCTRFDLLTNVQDANSFVLYQEWHSPAHFEDFRNSERLKALGEQIFPMLNGSPDAAYYQANNLN